MSFDVAGGAVGTNRAHFKLRLFAGKRALEIFVG